MDMGGGSEAERSSVTSALKRDIGQTIVQGEGLE